MEKAAIYFHNQIIFPLGFLGAWAGALMVIFDCQVRKSIFGDFIGGINTDCSPSVACFVSLQPEFGLQS